MHHYCAGYCKTPAAWQELSCRLARYSDEWLVFQPEKNWFKIDRETGLFIFGSSIGDKLHHIHSRHHFDNQTWTVVGGFPTFEKFAQFPPGRSMDIADWVSQLRQQHPHENLFESLGLAGGGWNISEVNVAQRNITAYGAPSGLCGMFYINNPSYFAVSNKPAILGALQNDGPYTEIDKQFLLWQVALASVVGYRTMWKQVRRIRPCDYIHFDLNSTKIEINPFPNSPFIPQPCAEADENEIILSGADEMADSLRWLLNCGFDIVADLTGGKDSRLILAALTGCGLSERISHFETRGSISHGDRIVAQLLANKAGLKNWRPLDYHDNLVDDTIEAHLPRFTQTVRHYDYFCSAWDSMLPHELSAPSRYHRLIGHSGDLFRQLAPPKDPLGVYCEDDFINWGTTFDQLGLLLHETAANLQQEIRESIFEQFLTENTINMGLRNQIGAWDNSRATNNPQRFTPLANLTLMRLANSKPNAYETIHYKLMRAFNPVVLEVPFLNQTWNGPD
ncbi:MAG: hypothetical protein KDD66_02690, partial [Bdellovibrionales bacterium]|nr:hypothetical protein [Bdellovibrionales bacterium]